MLNHPHIMSTYSLEEVEDMGISNWPTTCWLFVNSLLFMARNELAVNAFFPFGVVFYLFEFLQDLTHCETYYYTILFNISSASMQVRRETAQSFLPRSLTEAPT